MIFVAVLVVACLVVLFTAALMKAASLGDWQASDAIDRLLAGREDDTA